MTEKFNRLLPESSGATLCYEISKPITVEGYQSNFLEPAKKIIAEYGELRLVLYYIDYKGWEADAARQDLSMNLEMGKYLKKMALVNAPEKEIMARVLRQPLSSGELRFFDKDKLQDAIAWAKT